MHLVMTASMVVLESEGEECRKVPLSRLISLNKPEMPVLLLGTLAAVVSGVIFPMLGRRPGHARRHEQLMASRDGAYASLVELPAPRQVGALIPRWNPA